MGSSSRVAEEEVDEVYHVEVITKARVAPPSSDEDEDEQVPISKRKKKGKGKEHKKPKWEYLVKWANYDSKHNSWEPEENVAGCQRLLASFWAHVGTDDNDYDVGYEVTADEKWIKKEKRFFRQEYNEAEENLRKQRERERDERNRKKKTRKKKITLGESYRRSISTKPRKNSLAMSDEDSDDTPLIAKRKLDAVMDDSDDDTPLSKLPPRKTMRTNSPSVDINSNSKEPLQQEDVAPSRDNWTASLFSSPEPEAALPPPAPLPTPTPLPAPAPLPLPPVSLPVIKPSPAMPRHHASSHQSRVVQIVPDNVVSMSGISTKQRLSLDALDPRPPKAISHLASKSKNQPSHPRSSSSTSLISLSFKKATISTSAMIPTGSITDDVQVSTSPRATSLPRQEMPTDTTRGVVPSNQAYRGGERSLEAIASPHNARLEEADAFLRQIMPPALAGPLKPAEEQPFEPRPPRSLILKLTPASKVSQHQWTWSGNVFIETDPLEPAFAVTFCDVTAFVNGGLRFNVAMANMRHLHFSSFHDAVDLYSILSACQGAHQFARLGPKSNSDVEALGVFGTYLTKMQKIVLLPVSLDNLVVGHIIFFHHTTRVVSSQLKPPFEVQKGGSLVAALVPWTLSSGQLSRHHRHSSNKNLPAQVEMDSLVKDETQWVRTLRIKPHYHDGLRLLRFPRSLHTYLSDDKHERTFSVWFEGDGAKKKPGIETVALFKILEKCKTKPSRIRDARIIFIHVGAIQQLEKLPGLLEICSSFFSVQFYTYGTHQTVAPEFWGVREIYPCGGLVTFTPQALLDDPIGVQHRISQIHNHPMWECYILPSVLGMVAKLYCQNKENDSIADFDSGKFPCTKLLNAIDEGELSFISSPSSYALSTKDSSPQQEWVKKHWTHRPHGPRAILQASLDAFHDKYTSIRPTEWESGILGEISKDLRCMRRQPVFMEKYRRYVVIDTPRMQQGGRHEDALEWTSAARFDFKDDFFPLQS